MTHILALDIAGNPFRWMAPQAAAIYVASDKVAWSLGEPVLVLRGGYNRLGLRSRLELPPVIALAKSGRLTAHLREEMPLGHGNELLFRRDCNICGYCGLAYPERELTRDHILPTSRGGTDSWTNCVTACRTCNGVKGARLPEEWGRALVYLPYAPSRFEHFLLQQRHVLADQMQYLVARLPKYSRLL